MVDVEDLKVKLQALALILAVSTSIVTLTLFFLRLQGGSLSGR